MKNLLFLFLILTSCLSWSQSKGRDIKVSAFVDGTILVPNNVENPRLVIIVGDSGPTDRDGNQQMINNNSLKYLANGLHKKGIATFRYDKRIIKQMKNRTLNEESIRLDEFIDDAKAIIDYFKRANAFSKIYVIGHGQGSLVGMVAAQNKADGYVSIAGAGQEIDDVIVDQLEQQAPGLKDNARQAFDDMRATGVATNYSPGLASIFRESIQPFMLSWMKYNPNLEIAKLDMPVLIINGGKDLQVQVSEAEKLTAAQPMAEYELIPDMNHIFKEIKGNDMENSKSYNDPRRPIMPKLVDILSEFILK